MPPIISIASVVGLITLLEHGCGQRHPGSVITTTTSCGTRLSCRARRSFRVPWIASRPFIPRAVAAFGLQQLALAGGELGSGLLLALLAIVAFGGVLISALWELFVVPAEQSLVFGHTAEQRTAIEPREAPP